MALLAIVTFTIPTSINSTCIQMPWVADHVIRTYPQVEHPPGRDGQVGPRRRLGIPINSTLLSRFHTNLATRIGLLRRSHRSSSPDFIQFDQARQTSIPSLSEIT
ncbi:hypothetical protein VTK26DRAFT_5302 [Humicola hyalothermophila]